MHPLPAYGSRFALTATLCSRCAGQSRTRDHRFSVFLEIALPVMLPLTATLWVKAHKRLLTSLLADLLLLLLLFSYTSTVTAQAPGTFIPTGKYDHASHWPYRHAAHGAPKTSSRQRSGPPWTQIAVRASSKKTLPTLPASLKCLRHSQSRSGRIAGQTGVMCFWTL